MKKCKIKAFTFSEAILVLVILGVIAAITLRSVNIVNASQKGFDTKAEKAVSIIAQTFMLMLINETSADDLSELADADGKYSLNNIADGPRFVKAFKRHLEVNAINPTGGEDGYFDGDLYDSQKVSLGKLADFYSGFFFLQDGTLFGFRFYGSCTASEANAIPPKISVLTQIDNVCGSIFVDVNGAAKPNRLGLDQIIIPFNNDGIKLTND